MNFECVKSHAICQYFRRTRKIRYYENETPEPDKETLYLLYALQNEVTDKRPYLPDNLNSHWVNFNQAFIILTR